MALRTGMTEIVQTVRVLCEAGTADYSIGGEALWSDDALQDVLDEHRTDFNEVMTAQPRYTSSEAAYLDYYFSARPVERASSGTAVFHVYNALGSVAGTAEYAVNYRAGHVEFTADQGGARWLVRGRTFDLHAAAAAVWRAKAAHYQASGMDIATDNHSVKRSQLVDQALQMAEKYERMSGVYGAVRLDRSDAY